MGPATFTITHVFALAAAVGLVYLLRNVYLRAQKRLIRIASAAAIGSISTIIASYIIAHAVTPIILAAFRSGNSYQFINYSFMFWGLFLGMGAIGVMAGGLAGIYYAAGKGAPEDNED